MAQRIVVWTETAALQRTEILKYWHERTGSKKYSSKLIRLISSRIKVILHNPESFKATDFPDTRVSAIGHFSIFYKLTEQNLIVTAFWDNRQDPEKILEWLRKK